MVSEPDIEWWIITNGFKVWLVWWIITNGFKVRAVSTNGITPLTNGIRTRL